MRIVDLFAGCGGFSIGAHQAGFTVAAAFDIDPILTSSFKRNFPGTNLVLADVATLSGEAVISAAGGRVDGIFGGPPCQGFSDIGRREKKDPRRKLLAHFFRVVAEVEPAFFVMENVRGLEYTDARDTLIDALAYVKDRYQILGPIILDAADFGAATKRRRLFIIGIHKDRGAILSLDEIFKWKLQPATVKAAIYDLQRANFLRYDDEFDVWAIAKSARASDYAQKLRSDDRTFTGHQPTMHTKKVIERFKKVEQGAVDAVGRHPRLDWSGQCPTLRAGTGSDRGSYQAVRPLHPEEPRVITVREAARLQGFPDVHRFHPTIWHSFRMIGNSVSPLISKAIFSALKQKLVPKYSEMAAE